MFEVGRLLNFARAIEANLCGYTAPPGGILCGEKLLRQIGALCRAGCCDATDRGTTAGAGGGGRCCRLVLWTILGPMWPIVRIAQMPCYVQRPLPGNAGAPAQVAAPLAARVGRDGLLEWLEHLAHRPVSHTHVQPHIAGPRQAFIHACMHAAEGICASRCGHSLNIVHSVTD